MTESFLKSRVYFFIEVDLNNEDELMIHPEHL
jgi:hypothetical protein